MKTLDEKLIAFLWGLIGELDQHADQGPDEDGSQRAERERSAGEFVCIRKTQILQMLAELKRRQARERLAKSSTYGRDDRAAKAVAQLPAAFVKLFEERMREAMAREYFDYMVKLRIENLQLADNLTKAQEAGTRAMLQVQARGDWMRRAIHNEGPEGKPGLYCLGLEAAVTDMGSPEEQAAIDALEDEARALLGMPAR